MIGCSSEGEPSRGGELARIGPKEVRERYGVDPKQVPEFIALRGDPSDKLPGVAGVGPKRAAELLRRYGTLDGVLDAGLFQTQAEMLRLHRLIATMDAKAPLPAPCRSRADMGLSIEPRAHLGAKSVGRSVARKNTTSVITKVDLVIRWGGDGRNAQIPVIARGRAECVKSTPATVPKQRRHWFRRFGLVRG
jgi:5'-3' exonuclease, C-terminal SAM fold